LIGAVTLAPFAPVAADEVDVEIDLRPALRVVANDRPRSSLFGRL
jgi:hypothetical protein